MERKYVKGFEGLEIREKGESISDKFQNVQVLDTKELGQKRVSCLPQGS